LFWERVEDLGRLRQLTEKAELSDVIREVIEEATAKAGPDRPVGELHLNMEKERLALLMEEWLAVESRRIDFTAGGQETEKTFSVGGLVLSGRLDRIDRLAGGKELLIDYKTGKADPKDWLGDRPKEPQMMLYASSGQYRAVAFARLKRGECRFAGIAREADLLPGIKALDTGKLDGVEDWDGLMEDWRTKVNRLAGAFMAGEAAVDPRDMGTEQSACRYCEQKGLCRIFESTGVGDEF
jgi:RecB family exonuclease